MYVVDHLLILKTGFLFGLGCIGAISLCILLFIVTLEFLERKK